MTSMSTMTLTHQLLKDLRASWPKTAALVGLLCVGLWIWTPMLSRWLGGDSSSASSKVPAPGNSSAAVAQPNIKGETVDPVVSGTTPAPLDWSEWERRLAEDPLLAKLDHLPSADPFQPAHEEYPLPVLFEEEPPAVVENSSPPPTGTAVARPTPNPETRPNLQLQSTVVGSQRRAALINSRLVNEGQRFTIERTSFRLVLVEPQRVVIEDRGGQFEIKLSRSVEMILGHEAEGTNEKEGYPRLPDF